MEGRLLLKRATLVDGRGGVMADRAVTIDGGRVLSVGVDAEVPALPGDWVVPCDGRAVVPARTATVAQVLGPWAQLPAEPAVAEHCLVEAVLAGVGAVVPEPAHPWSAVVLEVGRRFGFEPTPSELVAGAAAGVVVLELWPAPSQRGIWATEACTQARAAWTIVRGRVLVREGQLVGFDRAQAALAAAARHDRWMRSRSG